MDNLNFSIKPKFNLIYELAMPTGKKFKSDFFILFLFFIVAILIGIFGSNIEVGKIMVTNTISVQNLLNMICYFLVGIMVVKVVFSIIFQIIQYHSITYYFYDEYMIYEDVFLNQHKKNIQYSNVKEVELRRTMWDRIFGFGVVIIYTNAENEYNNGLVLYGLKNSKAEYTRIDELVHRKDYVGNTVQNVDNFEQKSKYKEDTVDTQKLELSQDENDFVNSLKQTNQDEK